MSNARKMASLSAQNLMLFTDDVHIKVATTVIMYCSMEDELNTTAHILWLKTQGKTVLLPRVVSDTEMTLHRFTDFKDLVRSEYGVLEPVGDVVTIDEVNAMNKRGTEVVCVVPGMAFDHYGNRLGRGKGYYDRMLAQLNHVWKIGLCFPFQLVKHVPTDENDVRMNCVLV